MGRGGADHYAARLELEVVQPGETRTCASQADEMAGLLPQASHIAKGPGCGGDIATYHLSRGQVRKGGAAKPVRVPLLEHLQCLVSQRDHLGNVVPNMGDV